MRNSPPKSCTTWAPKRSAHQVARGVAAGVSIVIMPMLKVMGGTLAAATEQARGTTKPPSHQARGQRVVLDLDLDTRVATSQARSRRYSIWRRFPARASPGRGAHLVILVTRPAPTVRPPSRIANRRPSSMAMGWISSTAISVLSPGMTISLPSGRVTTPVTSVVRK